MQNNKKIGKKLRKKIDEILEYFNFEKVHWVMVNTNWKWGFPTVIEGVPKIVERVPTVEELKNKLKDLLVSVASSNKKYQTISTGGFEVVKNNKNLSAKFVFEECGWL